MVRIIEEKKVWDNFVARHSQNGGFLHSWGWGEFQKSLGRKIWRLGLFEKDPASSGGSILKAACLVIKQPLKFGFNYFYTPRGPVGGDQVSLSAHLQEFQTEVSKLAKEEKAVFWRLEPGWPASVAGSFPLTEKGFLNAPGEIQPKHTLILDLKPTLEEILNQMKPKARYNIGLAQRHQVKIEKLTAQPGDKPELLAAFYKILGQTASRQEFKTHSYQYFEKMWSILAGDSSFGLTLYLASHQNQLLGGILACFFGQTAVYLHGGMLEARRELMAPYFLQWSAIKDAKERGCQEYDFWGVAPENEEKISQKEKGWQGITRFKRGFVPNAVVIEYLGPHDFAFSPSLYRLYRRAKEILKK